MLYEMATGKRAFQKKTAIDTLAAILNEEPEPIATVNPQTPAPLRWIVERCLAKEPGPLLRRPTTWHATSPASAITCRRHPTLPRSSRELDDARL